MDLKGRITMDDVAADIGRWQAALGSAEARLNSIKYRIDEKASQLEDIAKQLRDDPCGTRHEGGIHVVVQPLLDDYIATSAEIHKFEKLLEGARADRIVSRKDK
jgi:hypothetical protein